MLSRLFAELLALRRNRSQAKPAPASAALEQARSLVEARRLDEAERAVAGLLEADPRSAQCHFLRGQIARKRGAHESAIAAYRAALAIDNMDAETWFALGLCCFRAGDLAHAHVYMRGALTLRPRDADILNELGLVEHAFGNVSCALDTFELAVNANPDHPEAWNNLGLAHAARGRVRDAKRCFLRAISIRPNFYTALCNLGLACQQLEELEEADRHLRAAIAANSELPEAWLNLGGVLQDLGRLEEARSACEEAIRHSAGGTDTRVALGGVLYRLGESQAAEREFRAALARDAASPEARLGLAQVLLARGAFAEGWDLYEARLKARGSPARHFPFPPCEGRPDGRRLLIYGEQGIGEEILFASCLPDVAREAACCSLVCSPRLQGLFGRSFPSIELLSEGAAMKLVESGDAIRDVACLPIGSLPRLYRRERAHFPRHAGYLAADPARVARWRERLAALPGARRFGIAWRGGRASTGRALRSLAPEQLAAVLATPGIAWVSLQHGAKDEELARLGAACGARIAHWQDALADLEETAALLCALDGSVTVASTVVHLGGALGRPVWVLTPVAPTWRYMADGAELPWYPSARLFRQARPGEWDEPVRRVAEALRA